MVLTEIKINRAFFIDPMTNGVITYGRLLEDLARGGHLDDDSKRGYSTLCSMLFHIVRGSDICVGTDSWSIDKAAIESVAAGLSGADFGGEGTWANAHPLLGDWLREIRGSKSRIRLTTSGTTGQPKQVVHSIETLTRGVRIGERHANDIWGLAYPLDSLAGLQVLFQALFNQNTVVQLFGLPIETVHESIEKYRITHLSCTPTFLKMMGSGSYSHDAVKRLTTGGERCDSSASTVVQELFPNARHRNIYALTEVGNLLIADGDQFSIPTDLQKHVTVIDGGLAIHRSLLADSIFSLSGDQDTPVSDSSDSVLPKHKDWFLTGDLVDIISDQPLKFKFAARQDEVINVGGHKVIPQMVEACLMTLPQVQQGVVYGQKNSVTGQIVVCDVVVVPGLPLDPVIAKQHLSKELPSFAVPRIFNIVESLRMTPTGKLCRRNEIS